MLREAIDLTDRVALVTGGGSGIGAACAHELAALGAQVVIGDLNQESAERVAADLEGKAIAVAADVTDRDQVREMVRAATDHWGALHIAVNCAGLGPRDIRPVGEASLDDWRRVTSANLDGTFLCMSAELAAMSDGGAVVNVASVLASVGLQGGASYVAAKHGVVGLTKAAALDHAARGIRVNAVGPAFVDTPMLDPLGAPSRAALATSHPIGRLGRAEEIAVVVAFLASPAASFITGAFVPVDGGYLAR